MRISSGSERFHRERGSLYPRKEIWNIATSVRSSTEFFKKDPCFDLIIILSPERKCQISGNTGWNHSVFCDEKKLITEIAAESENTENKPDRRKVAGSGSILLKEHDRRSASQTGRSEDKGKTRFLLTASILQNERFASLCGKHCGSYKSPPKNYGTAGLVYVYESVLICRQERHPFVPDSGT